MRSHDRVSVAMSPSAKMVFLALVASAGASGLPGELDLSNVMYNNLGGAGPDTGVEQSLRFGDVATAADGTKVDMSVTATSSYAPPDPSQNGLVETPESPQVARIASINMKAGASVDLLVKFFKSGSTTTAMAVPEFLFTVFDLERRHDDEEERFWISGFHSVYLTDNTWLAYRDAREAGICFKSTSERAVPNPSNPLLLSQEQRAHTATFRFENTESFELRIFFSPGLSNQDKNNWNFYFGSAANAAAYSQSVPMSYIQSSDTTSWQSRSDWPSIDDTDTASGQSGSSPGFQEPNPTSCSCNLDMTNVQVNNLGGLGPEASSGQVIRYGNVCKVDGKSVDLIIDAVGGYSSPDVRTNGRSSCGPYGSVSVQFGTMVVLEARFVNPETGLPVTITEFFLTIFDMDLHGKHHEKVSIRGFDEHFLTPDTLVTTEEMLGGTVFSSPSRLGDVTCPADPMALNTQQANVGATVLFKNVEQFGFSLEVLGPKENRTHTFLIGGTSSLNADCVGHGLPTTTHTSTTVTTTTLTETNTTVTVTTSTKSTTTTFTATVTNTTVTTITSSHTTTGTNTTSTTTFVCTGDSPSKTWSEGQAHFCCAENAKFCPTTGTNTTVPTVTNTTTEATTRTQLTTNTTVLTTTTTGAATVPTNTTTSPLYACSRSDDFAEWAVPRREWCCKHLSVGCPGSNPYNCVSGYALWKVKWSMQKKIWCCQHDNRGCLPSTATTTKARNPSSESYDCNAGVANWKFGWSAKKEAWCCREKKVGCRTRTTTSLAVTEPWHPFNCNKDLATWRSTWSHPKRQWCCRNFQKACEGTTQEPYDCSAGYKNWQTGWSQKKREFCCKSYNRGCTQVLKEYYELVPRQIVGRSQQPVATLLTAGTAALAVGLLLAVVVCRPRRSLARPRPGSRVGLAQDYEALTATDSVRGGLLPARTELGL